MLHDLHEPNILLGRQDRQKAKEAFKVLGPTSENLDYSVEAFFKASPALRASLKSSRFSSKKFSV